MRIELGPALLSRTGPIGGERSTPVWRVFADIGEFYLNAFTTLLGSVSRRGAITLNPGLRELRGSWTPGLREPRGERRRTAQLFLDDARRALVARGDVRNRAVERSIEDPNVQRAYAAKKHAMDLVTQRELGRGSPWSLPGVGTLRPYASEIADAWDVALDAFLEADLPLQAAFARRHAHYWRDEEARSARGR